MNFPSLPTDNLYKFLALSGLLIAGFSFTLLPWQLHELRLEVFDSEAEARVLVIEREQIERELSRLESMDERTWEEVSALRTSHDALRKSIARSDSNAERMTYLVETYRSLVTVSGGGIVLGGLLSIAGFRLWYTRVQRPLDERALLEGAAQQGAAADERLVGAPE